MPANDTIDLSAGYVKAPPAAGAIDLSAGYVDKKVPPPPPPPTIQPGPDAIPLTVDQNPQGYIQSGRATPEPWKSPEQGPKPGTGITGGADWLMDALTAPGTFLGRMFQPFKEPSHEERLQEKASGAPVVGNYPLIDPSVGMEPGFMQGAIRGLGGLTAPNQLPLALFSPESKAISGLFAAMTVPQATVKLAEYKQLKAAGKDAEANAALGELTAIGAMGTLATYHASGYAEHLATTREGDINSQRLALLSSLPPERQINVLKEMGVIPKDVDLESLMPSMARAKSGNLQIGADIGSLTQILGSSMYSNRGAPVVVKELLQNALDAVRPNGGGVEANLDRNSRTFTIKDTGVGMTPDEVYSVFTDIGASGKRSQAGASGGFGLAKIAPFMIPERMTLETTAHDTSTGKNITTSFTSTPEDIVSGNVKPKVTYSPADTPTGTSIKTYFPETKPEQGYDPHSFYDAEKFLRNFLGSSNLPTSNIKFKSGGANLEGMRDPVRESFTLQGPGGLYTFSLGDKVAKGESYPEYEVHNNGLYQFGASNFVPGAEKVSLPTRIVVDVKPNVREGATDYPFTTNREATTSAVKTFISGAIKRQLVDPKLQEVTDLVKAKYNNMPMLDLLDGEQMPIYDSGARLTVNEINSLRTSPAMLDISKAISSVFRSLQSQISNLPATLFGGSEKRPMGSTVGRVGILLADTLENGGARTYGVYVPDPSNPINQASVFINPFGWASLAEEGVKPHTSQEMGLFYNPDFAASQLYHTMVHELTHDVAKGHNEAFTTAIMNLDSFLGINAKIGSLEDIANAFRDPNDPSSIRSDFDELLSIYRESRGRPETEKDILGGESLSTRGQQPPEGRSLPPTPDAQVDREKALWNDLIAARGRGLPEEPVQPGSIPQGAGGEASIGDLRDKLKGLSTLLPDFTKAIGGGEERAAHPESGIAGATGSGAENEPPPPVISEAADSDLADHGVQVTRPGPDIGKIEKYGGSMTEMVRRLSVQGHPLSPILTDIVRQGVDAIKGMMDDTRDTLGGWKRYAKTPVSDKEWMEQVVPLLKDPDVDIRTRPPNVPDNVWQAYSHTRPMLEDLRVRMRDAIRIRMVKVGLPPEYIEEHVPDDWGIPFGYYPGIFEGDYAITKLINVDEKGNENWQPIETGWRDVSEVKAIKKAIDYKQANPGTRVQVKKDTYTLPGKDFSSRAKLIDLAKKLKVGDNADLEELVSSLYDEAAAAAYGPTRIAPRQYGHALKRESNLPGGATDMESFERFIAGSIRFIHLTPAREGILQLRNKIAEIAGMPEIQRPSDIPANIAYSHATQYPNIMARTDQFINGVEGRPGYSDVELRSALNSIGADPSFMSKVGRVVQEGTALAKLGFNQAKVFAHGLQSVWAGLPVLGPRYLLEGIAHAYNPKYNDLIQSIAPSDPKFNPIVGGFEALGNLVTWKGSPNSLVEALHTYKADYFSRGTGGIDWTKGTYQLVKDIGMSPFAAGIETTRRIAAVGAYRRALDRGMPEVQARDAASADVDRISGLYHAADNPVLLRNLPGPIAQFKAFSFKTAQMMYGFRTPQEWAYFLAATAILGYKGIPFINPLSGIALALTGEDIENNLKRKYPILSRGIFGLAGVDVPPGVGVGDLGLTRPQAPLGGILGPAASDAYSLAKGGLEEAFKPHSRQADQDFKDAIRNLSPAARRLMDESDRVSTNPSTVDPHTGSTILQHLTPLERAEMGAGFTPLRVAEERESHEYIRNLIANEKDKKGFFIDHMAANAVKLSQPNLTHDQKMGIVKDTIALGRMAAEEYGIPVHPKDILERAREMQLERLHRDFKLAPKAVRPQIYEEMKRFQEEQK